MSDSKSNSKSFLSRLKSPSSIVYLVLAINYLIGLGLIIYALSNSGDGQEARISRQVLLENGIWTIILTAIAAAILAGFEILKNFNATPKRPKTGTVVNFREPEGTLIQGVLANDGAYPNAFMPFIHDNLSNSNPQSSFSLAIQIPHGQSCDYYDNGSQVTMVRSPSNTFSSPVPVIPGGGGSLGTTGN